jgi:hypothetical protein
MHNTHSTRWLPTFVCLLVLGGALPAAAQVTPAAGYTPPDDTQSIRIGAVIFYDFTTTTSPKAKDADGNSITQSVFNVGRAYINVQGSLSHRVAFRITPDIVRASNADSALNGGLVYRIKYAYAQINLDDWTGDWKSTWVRVGIQQTPYVDYHEGIYRYRFQGTVFVERDGFLTSSDAGASFHTNLPNNFGEVHTGVYNGEGYARAELNDQKAFQIRGTVRPFARTSSIIARGVRVTAFYDADHYVTKGDRRRFVFNTMVEHAHINAGFDYLNAHDQTSVNASKIDSDGWSFWVTPFFQTKGEGLEALVRFDHLTPDDARPTQERDRAIAGVSYWFPHPGGAATAALLLDYERVKFPGFTNQPTQQRIAVHGLINF